MGKHAVARLVRDDATSENYANDLRIAVEGIQAKRRRFIGWFVKPKEVVTLWPMTETNSIDIEAKPLELTIHSDNILHEPLPLFSFIAPAFLGQLQGKIRQSTEVGYLYLLPDKQQQAPNESIHHDSLQPA